MLEIGCGLGRIAFAIRYLVRGGTYTGFEIVQRKIDFLERTFHRAHPHFAFTWADVHNSYYNPRGRLLPTQYTFPAGLASKDLIYAASVFTHMLPENAAHYFAEAARVLRPGGRCVFSFFLLDRYVAGAERPFNFGSPAFAFDLTLPAWGNDFAYVNADNPEQMTAYSSALIARTRGGRWTRNCAASSRVSGLEPTRRPHPRRISSSSRIPRDFPPPRPIASRSLARCPLQSLRSMRQRFPSVCGLRRTMSRRWWSSRGGGVRSGTGRSL